MMAGTVLVYIDNTYHNDEMNSVLQPQNCYLGNSYEIKKPCLLYVVVTIITVKLCVYSRLSKHFFFISLSSHFIKEIIKYSKVITV